MLTRMEIWIDVLRSDRLSLDCGFKLALLLRIINLWHFSGNLDLNQDYHSCRSHNFLSTIVAVEWTVSTWDADWTLIDLSLAVINV